MRGVVRRSSIFAIAVLMGVAVGTQGCQSDSSTNPPNSGGDEGMVETGGTRSFAGSSSSSGAAPSSDGGRNSTGGRAASDGGSGGRPEVPDPAMGGLGGDAAMMSAPTFVDGPTIVGNANPFAPQAAVLSVHVEEASALKVRVEGGDESWELRFEPATKFQKPIIGVLPDTEYRVIVSATRGDQTTTAEELTWHSPPLPEDLTDKFEVSVADPERMEPGMTFFSPRSSGSAAHVVVDHRGRIRWYYWDRSMNVVEDSRVYENGDIMMQQYRCDVRIVDWLGGLVASYYPARHPGNCGLPASSIPVDVESIHHEVARPKALGGNYLTLATEYLTVEDFPTSEDDPSLPTEPAEIASSVILEFAPDGAIVQYLSLADIVDRHRIGRDSLRPAVGDILDWDHANAVIYEESSDSYYVSQRHQDAVLKIRRSSGELVWILGNHANYGSAWTSKLLTPIGDLLWPYHQHAVELNRFGLAMYDNGNYRAPAYQEPQTPPWSRAVVYSIDEEAMTVSEVWSYGSPESSDRWYSPLMGDVDYQSTTGNYLITNSHQSQVVEVTQDGEVVFDLTGKRVGGIYRAQRLADIRTHVWKSEE